MSDKKPSDNNFLDSMNNFSKTRTRIDMAPIDIATKAEKISDLLIESEKQSDERFRNSESINKRRFRINLAISIIAVLTSVAVLLVTLFDVKL